MFFLPFWMYHWSAFSTSLQMYQCRTSGSTLEWYIWRQQMSRGTPQLVVAHHSAKFSCCGQYFMFGPPGHAFVSLLVVCLLRVCKKFSVLKYSVGVTCMFCSWLNRPSTHAMLFAKSTAGTGCFTFFVSISWWELPTRRATRKALSPFFHQPRRDFPAISGRPWILLLVNCLMSAFGKRFRNSARSFPLKRRTFFLACGVDSHFVHVYMYNGCAHDRCAPSNNQSRGEPTYIRLLSCSSYNSWYNLKVPEGRLHWLILIPTTDENLQNCQESITLLMFWKNNLTPC